MRYLRAIIFVCFSFSVIAQTAQTLTNKDIINMTTIGLPSNVIVAKIKKTGGKFDTSPTALKELKEAGVDNAVIAFMIEGDQPKISVQAQERPMPDRWRGIVIDESSPDDAIAKFGKPEKDELTKFPRGILGDLLTAKAKEKKFRRLEYKDIEGVDKAYFTFSENKLIAIDLDIKQGFSPNSLPNVYGLEFRPVFGTLSTALHPEKFERNQGKDYTVRYPTFYHLVTKSEKTFIDAVVENSGFGAVMKDLGGARDREGNFPGKVAWVQIVSRTLENRDGADALK